MAALPNMLRKSFSKAAERLIGTRRIVSSAATTTASINLIRHGGCVFSRRFCSDVAVSWDKKLLQVLESEVDLAEQSFGRKQTIAPPSDFPFSVKDNPGEQTITLTREYDGETIVVEVSMTNLVTGEEDEDEDEDEGEDGGDEIPRSNVPLFVTVTKKDGNAPSLEFDCTAFPDRIRINGLSLKNPEIEDQLAYEGPNFFDLDDNLQKAFHRYLKMRGIEPSTTIFLHEYMIDKDSEEYVRWLKGVKNFVEA